MSTADMIIKADVPSLHLRVDEVVDLAVPLALRPKKPWISKVGGGGGQPSDRHVEPAAAISTSSALPRKESRKAIEIKSAPVSKGSTSTESPTNPSAKAGGLSAPDVTGQNPDNAPSLGDKIITGIAGSLERARARIPSFGRMPVVAEARETKSAQQVRGEHKVVSPPSHRSSLPSFDAADRSLESVASAGIASDLAVPSSVFRPHLNALAKAASSNSASDTSLIEPAATFQNVMVQVEEQLRLLSSSAAAATTPDAALRLVSTLRDSAEVLANAVATSRERALHVASQNFEEIDLLSRNNAMLVQALAESQVAEMAATMLILHGPVSRP